MNPNIIRRYNINILDIVGTMQPIGGGGQEVGSRSTGHIRVIQQPLLIDEEESGCEQKKGDKKQKDPKSRSHWNKMN